MQSELKVSELYQAAYLVASGCQFPRVTFDRTGAKFIFADDDGLVGWYAEAFKLDHGNQGEELMMPVKKFIGAVRKLKTAMAAAQQEKKGSYENSTKTGNTREARPRGPKVWKVNSDEVRR
jgi:hypothetical protein